MKYKLPKSLDYLRKKNILQLNYLYKEKYMKAYIFWFAIAKTWLQESDSVSITVFFHGCLPWAYLLTQTQWTKGKWRWNPSNSTKHHLGSSLTYLFLRIVAIYQPHWTGVMFPRWLPCLASPKYPQSFLATSTSMLMLPLQSCLSAPHPDLLF